MKWQEIMKKWTRKKVVERHPWIEQVEKDANHPMNQRQFMFFPIRLTEYMNEHAGMEQKSTGERSKT